MINVCVFKRCTTECVTLHNTVTHKHRTARRRSVKKNDMNACSRVTYSGIIQRKHVARSPKAVVEDGMVTRKMSAKGKVAKLRHSAVGVCSLCEHPRGIAAKAGSNLII